MLAISILVTGLITFVLAYFGVSRIAASSSQALSFYSFWWTFAPDIVVVFCAAFFGGDAIAGEFQNKTGYFLVGNPIRRSSIYMGKWLAALIASLIIMAVYTGVTVANGLYYMGSNMPVQFVEAVGFTLVYLVAALGLTFLFSSLFKSGTYSTVVTFVLLLFGFTLIDSVVTAFTNIETWFSLTYGANIISSVFTVPYPTHITRGSNGAFTTYVPTIPEGLVIMGVYFIVTLLLGLILFERKEFN